MPYITPSISPTSLQCRALLIPDDEQCIAIVTGALQELTFIWNFESIGGITPQQAVDLFLPMFNAFCFRQGICRMIGEIITYAGSTSPNSNWLPCDGASLLRSAYPDLFAVIGTTYGAVDGSHFSVPDLRGRVPVASGSGPGLSTYALGQTGGEETHVLTVAESASHSHIDSGHSHTEGTAIPTAILVGVGAPVPSALPSVGVTGIGSSNLNASGSDGAHNNLQPYLAVQFFIVALG